MRNCRVRRVSEFPMFAFNVAYQFSRSDAAVLFPVFHKNDVSSRRKSVRLQFDQTSVIQIWTSHEFRDERDAYSRLSKAVDALSGDLGKALEEMKKAEAAIVYANRYRSGNEVVADALRQAETLFYDGDFERSYAVAHSAIPSSTPDAR